MKKQLFNKLSSAKVALVLGSLSLGAASLDAIEFRPYLETAVAPTVVCNTYQEKAADVGAATVHETQSVGMLSVALGSRIGELNSQMDFFAECEVDFLNHFSISTWKRLAGAYVKNEILPVFFNFGVQSKKNSDFRPYVYGGIGVSHIKDSAWHYEHEDASKVTDFSKTGNKLAWQAGVGVDYRLADNLFVDAGYTFAFLGKNKANIGITTVSVQNYAHEFRLGLKYEF